MFCCCFFISFLGERIISLSPSKVVQEKMPSPRHPFTTQVIGWLMGVMPFPFVILVFWSRHQQWKLPFLETEGLFKSFFLLILLNPISHMFGNTVLSKHDLTLVCRALPICRPLFIYTESTSGYQYDLFPCTNKLIRFKLCVYLIGTIFK